MCVCVLNLGNGIWEGVEKIHVRINEITSRAFRSFVRKNSSKVLAIYIYGVSTEVRE